MKLPVYVQRPCEPPGKYVGDASDGLSAEDVARAVGVPAGTFLEGKVIKSKAHGRRWSIVADVRFG